jgi:hypothetical protein
MPLRVFILYPSMISWAKTKVKEQLRSAGASSEDLSTAVVGICIALLFVALLVSAVFYFFDG